MSPVLLPVLIGLPLLGALVPLPPRFRQATAPLFSLIPAVQVCVVLLLWSEIQHGASVHISWPWLPALGLRLSLQLDGLSWLFVSLISGVGVLVFIYTGSYLHDDPHLGRLYRFLLLFNSAMMGVVLADNLVVLLVFWELTSVASFLLIGFRSQRAAACEGATKALGLTAGGGLVLLFGIFLVFEQTGSLELSHLLSAQPRLSSAVGVCFLVAAFTKSAQFPFHIWLPSAMEAPTPVSAYLHAATMVKAGLYLMARMSPLFATDPVWSTAGIGVGTLTLVWGGALACKQTDLKALLAYSTVSQLGLIVLLLGLGTRLAMLAAMLHIVNHAAFKGALFLTAGAVEHEAGTRDIRRLGSQRREMPLIAGAAVLACLSMAGLPPLGGFISKELFYESVLTVGPGLSAVAVAASCLTFLYSALLCYGTFFATRLDPVRQDEDRSPHPPASGHRPDTRRIDHTPVGMALPILVLSALALIYGLMPGLVEALITPALGTVAGPTPPPHLPHLGLWHGISPPLMLSGISLGVGLSLFLWRRSFIPRLQSAEARYSFNRLYVDGLDLLTAAFTWQRRLHMTGRLPDYICYMLIALILGVSLPVWQFFVVTPLQTDVAGSSYYEIGLALLTAVAGLACCVFRSLIAIILALSLVGSLVSIFFVLFSAPDLALTQILVEAVGLVLFLLVLRFFSPLENSRPSVSRRLLHLSLSVGTGVLVAVLLLAANSGQFEPSRLAPYFLENSYELAGGRNVVNVILVDFRGFDTMGEIAVFAVAMLAVFAMIELGGPGRERLSGALRTSFRSPILQSFARLTLHLLLLFAIYLLLRGHNAPGGGFIAGVLTAVAITFQMIAFDAAAFRRETPLNPLRIVSLGLLVAALTGLGAVALGQPFLTSAFGHFFVPLLGEVELATAMGFDIGVYLVVVGTTIGIIQSVAEA